MSSNPIESFAPVRIVKVSESAPALAWLEGLEFAWPGFFLENLTRNSGETFARVRHGGGESDLRCPEGVSLANKEFYSALREQILFTPKPASARFPVSYQRVPYRIRWMLATLVARLNRMKKRFEFSFPAWPLDLSLDSISDIEEHCSGGAGKRPFEKIALLTHDIDTPESLENLPRFLEIEESLGVRSTNFIVPRGWELDHSILQKAALAGHEIGVHGYNHDNRTPFLPKDEIVARTKETEDVITRYRCRGYRAPSLLRSGLLFEVLKDYFAYDSSIPNADSFFGNRGCASARPFYYNGLLEIPLTMPTDATLLFQGVKPHEILNRWMVVTGTIVRSGGVINLLTHCEKRYSGNSAMLEVYGEYIQFLKSSGMVFRTLAEVADICLTGTE